jgi:hypothetical protein
MQRASEGACSTTRCVSTVSFSTERSPSIDPASLTAEVQLFASGNKQSGEMPEFQKIPENMLI